MPSTPGQELALPVSVAHELLAAAPSRFFADLVHLAAAACGAAQAAVALAGPQVLDYRAQQGLAPAELPALDAFCWSATRASALVSGAEEPLGKARRARFWASVALCGPGGQPLGALCVLNPATQPAFSEAQLEALACLARWVTDYVAQALAQHALEAQQQQLAAALQVAGAAEPSLRPELFVKQDTRLLRVAPADVTHFEALGDYVNLYTVRERLTVYGTMKDMQARLPAHDFARIHRKYIIRLDRLVAVEGDSVLLDAGRDGPTSRPATVVPIGSSYKAALLARLQVL